MFATTVASAPWSSSVSAVLFWMPPPPTESCNRGEFFPSFEDVTALSISGSLVKPCRMVSWVVRPKMAMRVPGGVALREASGERVEEQEIDGSVDGRGRVIGEDAWWEFGQRRELGGVGGCEGCV